MLCSKFKQILITKPTHKHVYHPLIQRRPFSQRWFDLFCSKNMSNTVRLRAFKLFFISKFLNNWSRSAFINNVTKKCREDRGSMQDVFQYFRFVFMKPRKTHLIVAATAAYKPKDTDEKSESNSGAKFTNSEEESGPPPPCQQNISNSDMKSLLADLEGVNVLSEATLYCKKCKKRISFDSSKSGSKYCQCEKIKQTYEGWEPYMEAEDIMIWRKEYKPGGLYAYKVYGRYTQLNAHDFAMIQIDGAYRKEWDSAVASLSVVEKRANDLQDQTVLHWEVLWPRLFANRDYVYLRRHKEYTVKTSCMARAPIFDNGASCHPRVVDVDESPKKVFFNRKPEKVIVYSNETTFRENCLCDEDGSSREDKEKDKEERTEKGTEGDKVTAATVAPPSKGPADNRVYVIVSRSCVHPQVPETRNAIRVMEYWSHMVISTMNGPDEPGMEFVLTYYDEPAVGGLPTAVTSWAMGRAGPAFLAQMRAAATKYGEWKKTHKQETPEFISFVPEAVGAITFNSEEDITSSQLGPDIEVKETEAPSEVPVDSVDPEDPEPVLWGPLGRELVRATHVTVSAEKQEHHVDNMVFESQKSSEEPPIQPTLLTQEVKRDTAETNEVERDSEKSEEDEDSTGRWWRYLYPSYYFA